MISTVDKLLLNSDQQAELAEYTRAYTAAQAVGDQAGMALAHRRAEALRASAGYSGGDAGNHFMLLTHAQNVPEGYTGYEKLVNDVATGGMNTIAAGYQQQLAQLEEQKGRLAALQREYLAASEEAERLGKIFEGMNRAFLDEQAGVIAAGLKEGMPCPVCGSTEHPAPALSHTGEIPGEEAFPAYLESYIAAYIVSRVIGKGV